MSLKGKTEQLMKTLHRFTYLFIVLVLAISPCLSQNDEKPIGNGIYLGVFYGLHSPGGDLSDRFGGNFSVGGNLEMVKNKKWIYGVEGQFLFGKKVKENVFGGLVTNDGHIIGTNSTLADISIKQRGINLFGKFGRMHDLWSDEHLSGLKWTIGAGFFQHQIRLTEGQGTVPFIEGNYAKGYDRLSNGFGLTEFIGYQFFDGRGRLNFFFGGEFTQAFTKDRRGLNYNTREPVTESRFDMLVGLKIGMQVTIKQFKSPDEIWY